MPTFVLAIIALQIFLYFQDFILKGQYRETTVEKEMTAPYGGSWCCISAYSQARLP